MNALERLLSAIDGGRVLDVATGDGDFAAALSRHLRSYTTITGIDIDENVLSDAIRALGSRTIRFRRADAMRLPFGDGHFNTVAVSNALHHFESPTTALAEMVRVLVPGGTFVLQEMVADGLSEAQRALAALHAVKAEIDTALGISHGPTLTGAEVDSLVAQMPLVVRSTVDYADRLETDGREATEARFEFIEGYLMHVAEDEELYARLRRAVFRIKGQAQRVGLALPTQRVIIAHRETSSTIVENRIF
jgi:SAM-dependent methyltransferase